MDWTWDVALEDFLRSIRVLSTRKYYAVYAGALAKWADERDIELEKFTLRDMDMYLELRRQQGVAPNTLRHCAMAPRKWFRWLKERKYLDKNPLKKLPLPPAEQPEIDAPAESDVSAVMTKIANMKDNYKLGSVRKKEASFHERRNLALMGLMAECGPRVSEIPMLRLCDLDRDRRHIVFPPSKGKASANIPISIDLLDLIDAWLKVRPNIEAAADRPGAAPKTGRGFLFVTVFGDQMKPGTIRQWLYRMCDRAGVEKFTPHDMRRFALSEVGHAAGPLTAKEIGRHKSIKTTERYMSIYPDRVREGVHKTETLARVMRKRRDVPIEGQKEKIV